MVAYADLGGLGAKQGVPVGYDWVQPSLMPQVLPCPGSAGEQPAALMDAFAVMDELERPVD